MKKTLMILALTTGALLQAENTQNAARPAAQKTQVSPSNAAKACELTTEEQAFAAKLSDKSRKAFEKLRSEQRKDVMTSVKNGGDANAAIDKLASDHVASAEKANPAQPK